MIENFRLKVFRTVAEHKQFSKAAEHLYLTQPAVTNQIRALEEMFSVQLFDRSGKEVALTAPGELLLKYVLKVDELVARAEEEISVLAGEVRGELRIAASSTISQFTLPQLLRGFIDLHPGIHVSIESSRTQAVITAVMTHRAVLGLVEGPAHTCDVAVEPWMGDELALVAPAGHQWEDAREIMMSDLSSVRLLMRERGSGVREMVEQAMLENGMTINDLKPIIEIDSTEGILASIEAGLGVGFVSRRAARRALMLGGVKMVSIHGVRLLRQFSLVYNRPEPAGLPGLFLKYLRSKNSVSRVPQREAQGSSPLRSPAKVLTSSAWRCKK